MKKLLQALTAAILFLMPSETFGQAPTLGTAANFVLFTGVGAITNGATPIYLTHLTGNVGSNSGAPTGFGNVDGIMYSGGAVTTAATADVTLLSVQLDTTTPTSHPASATIGGGDTLRAGVYAYSGAATLTGTLYLDGQGNANSVFIFQIPGTNTFDPAPNSKIVLINGALACNVFWKVGGAIGSISTGTNATLRGTFVSNGAINLYSGDTLEGRALSTIGAISLLGTGGIVGYTPIGCGSAHLTGPTAPNLGVDKYFAILTGNGAVTDDGASHITGDVGALVGSISGFTTAFVNGTIHAVGDAPTAIAVGHLDTVYNYLAGLSYDIELTSPNLFGHNLVLTPHTYLLGAATTLTDTVILDAQGDANAVFVFQISGAIGTTASSLVKLINGTQAKNVYWKVTGATTPGTNSIFNGNVIGGGGAAAIDASATGSRINGRLLTTSGAITTHSATINPDVIDVAGPITGSDSTVCVGATLPLAGADTGGVWSASNTHASVSTLGIVTGISAGMDTVRYIATNAFGSDTAKYIVTVKPLPVAGPITGPSSVCIDSSITISGVDSGTFSRSNSNATISSTGLVTGVSQGLDTMTFIASNTCGSDTATKVITINPPANAGVITGPSTVCTGANITLADAITGGTWSASNSHATITSGGVLTGVTTGIDTIRYIVNGACGRDTATKIITVSPSPNAGTISGPSTVCSGSFITLTDGAAGGVWSASNTHATAVGGVVTGITAGADTISYSVTNSCGTALATKVVTVNPSPNAGTITGPSVVCTGTSITLSNATGGGTWSATNTRATAVAGVVTGVTAGADTIIYTVTNSCGTDTTTKTVTVINTPNAGVITGPSAVCTGSSITLTDAAPGGTWSATNSNATVAGGIVTGVTTGTDTIRYTVVTGCGSDTATRVITINPTPNAGTITGPSVVCTGTSITLSNATGGGTWSATNTRATVVGGVVTGVTAGADAIIYTVTNSCGTDTTTKTVTVINTPNAGVITGPSAVCTGSSITLTDAAPGGTWSATNSNATVAGGVVTGVTTGTDTIRYTVVTGCGSDTATKVIAINPLPNAGTITGPSNVCTGSSITLSNTTTGGTWSATNANATVVGGVVSGITAGTDTIIYTVVNSCGTDTTTKTITVINTPTAGTITGASSVCVGSSITLSDAVSGGVWSITNSNATITGGGIVTGITAGTDTAIYTVTTSCGSATATKTITVSPLPFAGSITGASSVCPGSSITLTNTTTGGTWSATNAHATVVSGIVTGITAGVDTIVYTVTNSCGTDTTTKTITINPSPNAGAITGASSVCVGSSVTLTDAAGGGSWTATNSNATVTGAGVVTGITAGIDTIVYTVSNSCGTASTSKVITVNPLPDAGTITGLSSVCVASSITLSNATTGGTWSASNGTATITSGGVVTGVTAGIDTIIYTFTNVCGTATTTHSVSVNPLATSGTISGPSSVCAGATITLTDGTVGGTWSSSNANATITSGGIVTGVAAGLDTITYMVSTICGTSSTTKVITVNPLPDAGIISGFSRVCVGSSISLTESITGGTWSSSNANATLSASGIVTGIATGLDTISYTVSNTCGFATATTVIKINALPILVSTTTPGPICDSSVFSYVPSSDSASANFTWSRAVALGISNNVNSGAGTINEALMNITNNPVVVTYVYTTSANGCSTSQNVTVTVNPTPKLSSVVADNVCSGTQYRYHAVGFTGGTSFTWSRAAKAGISPSTASGAGDVDEMMTNSTSSAINVAYVYILNANGCSFTQNVIVTVNPIPGIPTITTSSPTTACSGTMYQNFGTTTPAAGIVYTWSATNATIWARSSNGQNALVNFTTPGTAEITLSTNIVSFPCKSKTTFTVTVSDAISQVPVVNYFQYHFVCTPNNEASYQWGYDNAMFDSTILTGEINQDYVNASPDFANKYYWVMTRGAGGCNQKTYYRAPTAIENVNTTAITMELFPNPANDIINVSLNNTTGDVTIEVMNMAGQKLTSVLATDNKARIDVAGLAAGVYMVSCYKDGARVGSTRFIKN